MLDGELNSPSSVNVPRALIVSLLVSEVADFARENGKHGFQLLSGHEEMFLLLFADDIVLLSSTPSGLQNQIDSLEKKVSQSMGVTVNLDKTKVMVFRKGGYLTAREKWFYSGNEIEVVNSYKYVGYTLTTTLSSDCACEDYASRVKGKVLDLMKTMWSLGSLNTRVFFQLYINSTIFALKYWLKVDKMPMNRFPKQAYLMMKSGID